MSTSNNNLGQPEFSMSSKSYVKSTFGKITLNVGNDGIVLTQEGRTGDIALAPEEMEKLAKALFAVKKNSFPSATTMKSSTGITYPAPKFSLPPLSTPKAPSYMEQQKAQHSKAYTLWTPEDDERLKELVDKRKTDSTIAELLGRNDGAITSRKAKLGLL